MLVIRDAQSRISQLVFVRPLHRRIAIFTGRYETSRAFCLDFKRLQGSAFRIPPAEVRFLALSLEFVGIAKTWRVAPQQLTSPRQNMPFQKPPAPHPSPSS